MGDGHESNGGISFKGKIPKEFVTWLLVVATGGAVVGGSYFSGDSASIEVGGIEITDAVKQEVGDTMEHTIAPLIQLQANHEVLEAHPGAMSRFSDVEDALDDATDELADQGQAIASLENTLFESITAQAELTGELRAYIRFQRERAESEGP